MSIRYALITLMAIITGLGAGALFDAATHSLPLAVIAGCTAFGGAWRFYDEKIVS
jgi:hypothetical protein